MAESLTWSLKPEMWVEETVKFLFLSHLPHSNSSHCQVMLVPSLQLLMPRPGAGPTAALVLFFSRTVFPVARINYIPQSNLISLHNVLQWHSVITHEPYNSIRWFLNQQPIFITPLLIFLRYRVSRHSKKEKMKVVCMCVCVYHAIFRCTYTRKLFFIWNSNWTRCSAFYLATSFT